MKHIKQLLKDSWYRRQHKQYVAEGARWIADALKNHADKFIELFVREDSVSQHQTIIEQFRAKVDSDRVTIIKESVFNSSSDTKNSQGILAVLKMPEYNFCLTKHNKIILLDGIKDPSNAGTIVRTALAAGFNTVIFDDCIDPYNPKVVRGSMGAMLDVNIIIASLKDNLQEFKSKNHTIVGATLNGENPFTNKFTNDKLVLVIGGEANGIRQDYLPLLDKKITIPMQKIESLNAAVASGILMYQLARGTEQ